MRKVRVVNRTRETCLAERADLAGSWWERGRGLLGRSGLSPGEGMVLRPANWVHSFFMAFTCSLVYVDRQGRVVRVVDRLRPNRVEPLVLRSRYVVELPPDVPSQTGTAVGDWIEIEAPRAK